MVEITPEMQAQFDEQKAQCPFCKIIKGEIESKKVYEDKHVIGILDINPTAEGHVLLLPKEHYPIMPYLPPKTFKHMFGILPKIISAVKKSTVMPAMNVIIANGGAAGQQSPHFLIHLVPRESGDGKDLYSFSKKGCFDTSKSDQINSMLANNIPVMMRNHFQRIPVNWLKQSQTASFLADVKKKATAVYEDNKALCVLHDNPSSVGHLAVYSNECEDFEALDPESAAHMFYVASYCATAAFEGMGAHGSNIILKSGVSDDNPSGLFSLHILPRFGEDGLDLIHKPLSKKPDLDYIAKKITDATFEISASQKSSKKPIKLDLDESDVETLTCGKTKIDSEKKTPSDEIKDAIERIRSL